MTTLLTISTPLFIVIIGALVGIIAFLLWVLRVVLRQNEGNDYTYEELMSFAQSVTNKDVDRYDFDEWAQMNAECGDCGNKLTLVRPGSHQCDNAKCASNLRFSDN